MECTSDLDLEEIESRLYSQVFHSTEDWESDSVTPNMILNDMSNRHVSNYTVNNVTHSNANRYWCGQNSVMISPQTMRPAVPLNHVPYKKMPENEDRQEQLRKNRELRKQLRRQRKQNKRREKKLAKKLNSILVNNSATVDNGSSILVNNSATVDNGKYCNNPAAKCDEIGVNTSYNSGMFADDSIIYQRIDVPSPIHEPATENVTNDDVQSPVMQQLVSSTSNVVNDNDADVIVLSDDSDSDSVMEVLLPPPPIYTVDSSNDSDTSVSSKKGQVIATISAAPDVDVNVSVENSLLGSNEKSMGTSHDTNVIENVADGLNTSLIVVENTSDNKELETLDQDDLTLRDDTSILDGIPKAKEVTNSSDMVGITEEERTALLCSPDSNTNDFIANDVDNMNKNAWGFNFMLHGSDLDLSNKDPEKLNRTSGVPSTDIYETESSCSEAGTFISKAPVFHEIDFESPTKEIFCEPNLTSFSKFITPVRKTKSMDASKTSPRLSRVKTKALSLIERTSEHTTKDGNTTQEKAPCDTDEYNSDATMLQVKKKSKKKKKKNKKNKDKLNAEADSEMVEEVIAYSEAVVNTESRKSNSKNETDNKIVASEKSKKSSNKNTNDEKSSDKEKGKKSSNKSEDDDKQEKNENKNKKQLKIIRDLTANVENSEKIIQHDDVGVDIDKSGSSDKNKKPKKVSSRDIPGNSLNSDMNIVTITEQQITSQLPSKTGNEFSFVETLNKIENKSEEESAEGKVEITDENITMANDIEKGTVVMESSSGENGGLKRFSFVGTWNKLNQQGTENQENSASGVNLNTSIEQNTSIECNQTTDQDPLTCSDRNKSTEPLNEYISLNFMEGNEKITENLESSKSPKNVEIESNQTYTSSENNSSYVPQTLKSNDTKNRNKNIQHSPSENPGSSSSKKPKKSERSADVIVLSSDSDSDTEFNSQFKFYKDPDKDINISENFMLNTSSELNKSFDIDAAGTSSSNVRISKYNLVVNPFSVGKMKKSFKDYWTSDMARFYDESWGQENYDIQQVLSSMPSDKSKWKIILEDQRPARQSRKRGPVCLRCREPGHPQFRCTRYPGPVKCSTCGCSGHAHTRCPNLMCTTCGNKGGYHTTSCYKCGHYARIRCNVCNMSGHLNTNCPDLWRRYHLTTQDTLYLSSSQTSLKPITQRWCSHCARRGHFQDACPYGNFEHFPTNNRIMSYDPLYNRTVNFLTSTPEEENIPMLPNTTLSDIRNYKDTIIEHNNKKYENILKTLRRQCMKSNLQYVDQINKIEKSLKQNQFSRKNIGNIYKIRSLIQKHARD